MDLTLFEALCAAAVLLLVALLPGRWAVRRLAIWTALFVAATGLPAFHKPGPSPEMDANAQEVVLLTGCVVEPSVLGDRREQFTVELAPQAKARVTMTLREGQTPPRLSYGQRVEFEGRVRKPQNFRNPGAFDYEGYLARRDIFWNISMRTGSDVAVLEGSCGNIVDRSLFAIRGWILDRLDSLYAGDNYKSWMMQALLIGENSRLEKAWTESFKRTGTYHALVISGIHITMVAGLLFALIRFCSGRQTLSLIMAFALAWLYAALSGMTMPALRAAAGFSLFTLARHWHRDSPLLNFVAVIAIPVLLLDPRQLTEASFQLSFLSVVAIVVLADPLFESKTKPLRQGLVELEDWRQDLRRPFWIAAIRVELRLFAETLSLTTGVSLKRICKCLSALLWVAIAAFELFAISIIVQVALALPMAIYFHRASMTGMFANILVVPMMNLAVVLGFVAVFTGFSFVAGAAGALLDGGQWVATQFNQMETGLRIPDPPVWLSIAFVAGLIGLAIAARQRAGNLRWACLSTVMLLFGAIVVHPFAPKLSNGQLEVTAIDVGQGESILIVTPEGKMMVVDGGGVPQFKGRPKPRLDIGEDVVSSYLWTRSIRRLDAVALTHAHDDHAAGLEALIENFRPAEIWTGAMGESETWKRIRAKAQAYGVTIVPRWGGDNFAWGGASFEVLAPFSDQPPSDVARNNDSLVMRIGFGKRSVLLTGDAEKEVEWRIAEEGHLRGVDILKAGHHGSRTSTTAQLLDAAKPTFALISAGPDNLYKHPHPDVMARLEERHISTLRTDRWGLLRIVTDGIRINVERAPWRDDATALLPVFE